MWPYNKLSYVVPKNGISFSCFIKLLPKLAYIHSERDTAYQQGARGVPANGGASAPLHLRGG